MEDVGLVNGEGYSAGAVALKDVICWLLRRPTYLVHAHVVRLPKLEISVKIREIEVRIYKEQVHDKEVKGQRHQKRI